LAGVAPSGVAAITGVLVAASPATRTRPSIAKMIDNSFMEAAMRSNKIVFTAGSPPLLLLFSASYFFMLIPLTYLKLFFRFLFVLTTLRASKPNKKRQGIGYRQSPVFNIAPHFLIQIILSSELRIFSGQM
jgi:hypothetical protein